jgi:pimeloyl-ACP methyl ester carboxylesterase
LQLQACDSNKDGKLSVEEFLPCPQPYSPIPPEAVSGFLEPDTANPTIQKFKAALDKNGDNLLDIEQELKSIQQKQLDAFPNVPGFGASGATFLEDWQKNGSVTSVLPAFKKPVLLLNGEGDIQTVVQGAREVDAALEKAGNPDHKLITYPGLGHTFYPVKGFSQPLGPMQEQVLKDMGDWLSQHFGRK